MKSRFVSDPLNPFGDGVLNSAEDAANPHFFPASFIPMPAHGGGTPPASPALVISPDPFPIVPAETLEAQAAQNGPGGPGSVVTVTSATGTGITFNLVFDAAAMAATSAATAFRAGIQQAASILSATITDNITVTLNVDYSGTGGGAAAGPDTGLYVNYSTVRTDLVSNATKGDPTFNALPTGSTIQGQSQVAVWDAQLKLFGLALPSNYSGVDGTATFSTDINPSLLVGVALHELTHALGRVPYGSAPDIFDFFRSTSPGTELFSGNIPASAAYFSVDGGYTKIADYGQNSDPSDFLNSGVQGGRDSFNEFYTGSTLQSLTAADKEQLDALGFHLASPLTTTIQTDTNTIASTSLVQFFNNYYLQNASNGTGPELKYGGTPITSNQGGWAPIGTVQTSTGYLVAWKEIGVDQYTEWSVDSSGNYISNLITPESGTSLSLENAETVFHQDLNGDGTIGSNLTQTVVEAFGATKLAAVGNNYYLESISAGTGPELKYGGVPIVLNQGGWAPIGAEQTSTGYVVVWKEIGVDQYTEWATDSSGNYVSNLITPESGASLSLENAETTLHQDLNGDGTIGPAPSVIEAFGSTELVAVGNNYFLDSISTGAGPELQYGGAPIVLNQGGWAPIAAEQTSTGYVVAWKEIGVDQYSEWATDSSGNYVSNLITPESGASFSLEAAETVFHQDLNHDGTIGPVDTVIEAFGATSLVQFGNNYYLPNNSTGTGPELKYGGGPIVLNQGGWAPIGAEQTSTGYVVAWKEIGVDLYTEWATDSSGNYVSNLITPEPGSSLSLENAELVFSQDLNGDGTIGIPPSHTSSSVQTSTPSAQLASATVVNSDTFVFPTGSAAAISSHPSALEAKDLGGIWSVAGDHPSAIWHDLISSPQPPSLPPASEVHNPIFDAGRHDGLVNLHIADLHANGTFIH